VQEEELMLLVHQVLIHHLIQLLQLVEVAQQQVPAVITQILSELHVQDLMEVAEQELEQMVLVGLLMVLVVLVFNLLFQEA
jgi:transcriptional regulator NrdR family protein